MKGRWCHSVARLFPESRQTIVFLHMFTCPIGMIVGFEIICWVCGSSFSLCLLFDKMTLFISVHGTFCMCTMDNRSCFLQWDLAVDKCCFRATFVWSKLSWADGCCAVRQLLSLHVPLSRGMCGPSRCQFTVYVRGN
jgi:hypothetical protein